MAGQAWCTALQCRRQQRGSNEIQRARRRSNSACGGSGTGEAAYGGGGQRFQAPGLREWLADHDREVYHQLPASRTRTPGTLWDPWDPSRPLGPLETPGTPWDPLGPLGPPGTPGTPWDPLGPPGAPGTPWDALGSSGTPGTPWDPLGPLGRSRLGCGVACAAVGRRSADEVGHSRVTDVPAVTGAHSM